MSELVCDDCRLCRSEKYCCCDQVNLCGKCTAGHLGPGHLIISISESIQEISLIDVSQEETMNYDEPLNAMLKLIEEKIQEVQKTSENHYSEIMNYLQETDEEVIFEDFLKYEVFIDMKLLEECFPMVENLFTYQIYEKNVIRYDIQNFAPIVLNAKFQYDITSFWTLFNNDCIYIVGGTKGFMPNQEIYKIDLLKNKVSIEGAFSMSKYSFGCLMNENLIYILGGRSTKEGKRENLKEVETFHVVSNKFERLPDMNMPRYGVVAVVHNKYLLVLSENAAHEMEKLLLDGKSEFEMIRINVQITKGCSLVSTNEFIFIYSNSEIGTIDDQGNFKTLTSLSQKFGAEDNWDTSLQPISNKDKVYFFVNGYLLQYSISSNTYELKQFTYPTSQI